MTKNLKITIIKESCEKQTDNYKKDFIHRKFIS